MAGLNLFDMLNGGAGQGAVNQIGQQFGLDAASTQAAMKALLPALSGGLKRNVSQPGGLESLLAALNNGNHDRYLDQPDQLGRPESIADGNAILGHLLGSKETSRAVAARAAQRSGVSDSILKQMLPVIATMAMGALSKQTKEPSLQQSLFGAVLGGNAPQAGVESRGGLGAVLGSLTGAKREQQAQANPLGMFGNLLDADGDGNAVDDIFDMVMKR